MMLTSKLRTQLASAVHDAWIMENRAKGVTSAISRITGEEQMIPFSALSPEVQAYDYAMVDTFVEVLKREGLTITEEYNGPG